ncbi:C6 finger domain transcription factor iacK [Exophiala dermatitidis]
MSTVENSTSSGTSTSVSKSRSKPPSLLACIPCRRSHLKCNGEKPLCKRCADRNGDCFWVDSRRGYREFRKNQPERSTRNDAIFNESQTPHLEPPFVDETDTSEIQTLTYDELFPDDLVDPTLATMPLELQTLPVARAEGDSPGRHSDSTMSLPRDTRSPGVARAGDDLIELFYKHFYPCHPFVAPKKMYLDDPSILTGPLRAVIHFLASHYVPGTNQTALGNAAKCIFADDVPDDGFKVQGLLLYAMTCFARFAQNEGAQALSQAIEIALRIGINRQSFAIQHGRQDPTVQEMWRRTWWTLFVIEGTAVVMGGQSQPFQLYSAFNDVPLPGDDEDYNDLRASPLPRSLLDLRDRVISEDTYAYSSFAYAVEATYILGSVLALGSDTFAVTDPQVEAIDASITNYFLSLPSGKREIVGKCGRVDECLLMAHLLANWAAISLHRPRSSLTFIRNHYRTTCTRSEAAGLPALAYSSHTAKALRAANNIISLATVQHSMSYAPPVLVCGITTAATVHLPAYGLIDRPDQAIAIKERLKVAISALAAFGEIWPRANIAKGQVATFAREVLTKPNLCVSDTGPETIPRITSDPIPQLQYDVPFKGELWMESLIDSDANAVGGQACTVFDNFPMSQAQNTAALCLPALQSTT